jgi:hypothetical protein
MHHEATTSSDVDIEEEGEATATSDAPMRPEDVPPRVRLAAAGALQGAPRISIVHTSSGQYEAEGIVDGEEQEVTISPSGAIIDTEDLDDIDLDDDDDDQPDTATREDPAPDDDPDDELAD